MSIFRVLAFLLFTTASHAQNVGASMQGAVTDASGASVARAVVAAISTAAPPLTS